MSTPPLPAQSERLSSAGFDRLYELVAKDPQLARAIARSIEENPRAALYHAFRLTKAQKAAIDNTTDDELRRRSSRLVAELRSASPAALRFDPGSRPSMSGGQGGRVATCGCDIDGPARPPPPPPHLS